MKRTLLDLYSIALAAALVTGLSSVAWANPHSLQYPTSHTLIALQGIPVDVPPPGRGAVQTDATPTPEHPNPSITQSAPDESASVNANANEAPPPPKKKEPTLLPGGAATVPPANTPTPGSSAGNASPQTNGTPVRRAPTNGPTPPGFPFGPPVGTPSPAGPGASGPTPGFKSYPEN